MESRPSPDLSDPRWLPLSFDVDADSLLFAATDLATVGGAPFLDQRMGSTWNEVVAVPVSQMESVPAAPAPAWLFHTAFCGSTLLARALHSPPASVALKEPHALMAMAQLSLHDHQLPPGYLDNRLGLIVRLLSRPWCTGGRVLIKPSNAVNRLLPRLLEIHPAAKGILLHGTLEDFLVSCCKKLPSAVAPMRWMVRYVLTGTMLERNLQIPQEHEFSFAEACVLTWHAQIELYAKALADDHHQQLRSIGMQDLLWNPESSVRACSRWLGMAPGEDLAARVEQVFSHDSKRPVAVHGQKRREAERDSVLAQHGRLIDAALAWSEQVVAPVANAPSDWKPLQS